MTAKAAKIKTTLTTMLPKLPSAPSFFFLEWNGPPSHDRIKNIRGWQGCSVPSSRPNVSGHEVAVYEHYVGPSCCPPVIPFGQHEWNVLYFSPNKRTKFQHWKKKPSDKMLLQTLQINKSWILLIILLNQDFPFPAFIGASPLTRDTMNKIQNKFKKN